MSVTWVALLGCQGTLTSGGAEDSQSSTDDGAQPAALRRLTQAELEASIRHVLQDDSLRLLSLLPEDPSTDHDFGFPRALTQLAPISASAVEQLDTLANELAANALASAPNDLLQCMPTAADEPCAVEYLTGVLRRAFRRPATTDEINDYVSLAKAAGDDVDSVIDGLAFATAAALQSPMFLYLSEYGVSQKGKRRLTAHELAARLSFFLIGSPPDAPLAEKADNGQILDVEVMQAEADRLQADPRARQTIQRFFAIWLGYDNVETLSRNSSAFPKFNLALAQSMRAEMEHLVDEIIETDDFQLLLTSRNASVDPLLADLYGVEVPDWAGETNAERIERWEAESTGRGCNADNVPLEYFNICSASTVLSKDFSVPSTSSALFRLTIRAYGTRADNELPKARVQVNGKDIALFEIDALEDDPQEYTATFDPGSDSIDVAISLSNDLFVDAERNRDVIVDWVQLDRITLPSDGTRAEVVLPETRAGVLTRGAILATYAKPIDTSPTTRGLFIRNRLLCESVPDPPEEVDTVLPERTENIRTNRERVAVHLEQGTSCNGCHRFIDPLGLPLENFDGIGEYRTHDQGVELDVTGDVNGSSFDGATEFGSLLTRDPRVFNCAGKLLRSFAVGHDVRMIAADRAVVPARDRVQSDSFNSLIKKIVGSEAFRSVTDAE